MNGMEKAARNKHLKEHQDHLATIGKLTAADKKETYNIIMILMDDLGWGDLSCFGSKPIHTPNLDRLAEEGIIRYVSRSLLAESRDCRGSTA